MVKSKCFVVIQALTKSLLVVEAFLTKIVNECCWTWLQGWMFRIAESMASRLTNQSGTDSNLLRCPDLRQRMGKQSLDVNWLPARDFVELETGDGAMNGHPYRSVTPNRNKCAAMNLWSKKLVDEK